MDTKIADESITCFDPECKEEIPEENIREYMLPNKHDERLQLLAEKACGDKSFCPKKTCGWYCIPDGAPRNITCQKCSCKYCPQCNMEWTGPGGRSHSRISCQEYEEIMGLTDAQLDEKKEFRKN